MQCDPKHERSDRIDEHGTLEQLAKEIQAEHTKELLPKYEQKPKQAREKSGFCEHERVTPRGREQLRVLRSPFRSRQAHLQEWQSDQPDQSQNEPQYRSA